MPLGNAPLLPPVGLEEPGRPALPREPESEGREGMPELEEEPLDDDGRLGMDELGDDEAVGMPGIEELDEDDEGEGSEGLLDELDDEEEELGMLGAPEELEEELVVSQADSTRASALAVIRLARDCTFILDLLLPSFR